MKLKVALVLMMSMIFTLGLTGVVSAQSLCDSFTFTHGSALPGGSDTVCGTVPPNTEVSLTFDAATQLGSTISDANGAFCLTFTVPATATADAHLLSFLFSPAGVNCAAVYAVEASVPVPPVDVPVITTPPAARPAQAPVVVTPPATLPRTGFTFLPAGGLLAGGLGMLLFGKRFR